MGVLNLARSAEPFQKEGPSRDDTAGRAGFTALFGGVLGWAQDLQVILDAAKRLRGDPSIRFVLVGDGSARKLAQDMALARGLQNVEFRNFVPSAEYAALLKCAGCGLVTLKLGVTSIPSKIGVFLAAGVPVVAALPDGAAADLVERSGGGLRVRAGDDGGLARAIAVLANAPAMRQVLAEKGKTFAERELSLKRAINAWDDLLRGLRC